MIFHDKSCHFIDDDLSVVRTHHIDLVVLDYWEVKNSDELSQMRDGSSTYLFIATGVVNFVSVDYDISGRQSADNRSRTAAVLQILVAEFLLEMLQNREEWMLLL